MADYDHLYYLDTLVPGGIAFGLHWTKGLLGSRADLD
jgi:hypothetical protein